MAWTRAIDLQTWAAEREAQGLLPLLIRKLIANTAGDISKLNIPALEQVGRPGFDGSVEVGQGNRFVPTGLSVWEMGVDQDPRQKAERDYDKRLAESSADTSYVFVTPRVWQRKDEWAAQKNSTGAWKQVLAYDANDLEHWLEMTRGVDAWISTLTQRLPQGLKSLQSYWGALSATAVHPLVPRVFSASRETEVAAVFNWLASPADSLFLRTASLHDGLDFLAALAAGEEQKQLGDKPVIPCVEQLRLQDAIVVHTAEEWRQLVNVAPALTLLPSPTLTLDATDVAAAVEAGSHVFVSGPRAIVPAERAVELRGLAAFELEQSLEASGFSASEAARFAKAACGSSTILKRLITRHPAKVFPAWAQDDEAARLAPYALVGGWRHVEPTPPTNVAARHPLMQDNHPIDIDVVTGLVACEREELEQTIARWSTSEEPLFTRFGDRVLVTSRDDAWYLLGHALTDAHLRQFSEIAEFVLDEDNPAFELEEEKRWMASLYNKTHTISGELRRSLVESLALMAVFPTSRGSARKAEFMATVQRVVDKVLPTGANWQRWASLGENLQTIAEAVPEQFLDRLEKDLQSQNPAVLQLFREGMGGFTGGSLHCSLLWALEVLAWSPEYLARSAVLLAKLAARSRAKSNQGNTAASSLSEIFCWWLWHTNASTNQRLDALRDVVRVAPEAGWKLLQELLPAGLHSISHNTAMPRWRDWADGWSREATQPYCGEYAVAVAKLVIHEAVMDPARWADIIDGILRVSHEITDSAVAALNTLVKAFAHSTDTAFALWSALRQLIAQHQRFEDAHWTFDRDLLARLSQVRDALVPTNLVLKYQWLFELRAELHEPRRVDDYLAHEKALRDARASALRDVIGVMGPSGLFKLLELGADANAIGWILAEDRLVSWDALGLPKLLNDDGDVTNQLAGTYLWCAFYRDGWNFIESLPLTSWSPSEVARLALALPSRRDVWEWVATLGTELEDNYWKRTNQYLREVSLSDFEFAVNQLLQRGRAFAAIRLLRSPFVNDLAIPSELTGRVLESALQISADDTEDEISDLGYTVQELVGSLQQDHVFDRLRLARIEWGFLPLLERSHSKVGPDTLTTAVAESPQLFVEIVAAIFRSDKVSRDEKTTTERDEIRASRAYDFLRHLDHLPGILEKGSLNSNALAEWIQEVRRRAQDSGHSAVSESMLGEVFGRAISGQLDDPWIGSDLAPFLEANGSDELCRGMITGLINSRGMTSRALLDGGKQEHEIAARYRDRAKVVRSRSCMLAATFDSLAEHYEAMAAREDEDAARLRAGR